MRLNKRTFVISTAIAAIAAFSLAAVLFDRYGREHPEDSAGNAFVRPHSPVIGPTNAPVTIVEFFDPACETCRAFYPVVKQIMAAFPNRYTRLVIRYAPFHKGSDETVHIVETARRQNVLVPVLESMLARQPQWAQHGSLDLARAWDAAAAAGLDVARAASRCCRR